MQTLKNIGMWLFSSSKDSTKISLTIKGALGVLVTYGTVILGFGHINIDSGAITAVVDSIVQIAQLVLATISAVAALYGTVRKVWLSLRGQHWMQQTPQA